MTIAEMKAQIDTLRQQIEIKIFSIRRATRNERVLRDEQKWCEAVNAIEKFLQAAQGLNRVLIALTDLEDGDCE